MSTKKLNPKLLIVEDNVSTFNNLVRFFEKNGFLVIQNEDKKAVDSYENAMALIAITLPDIVILDIELKGDKNGLILGQHIFDKYGMPIMFLTGNDTIENRTIADQFASIPMIEKLSKSLPNEMLLKSIHFLWAKILNKTPAPNDIEIWAAEMKVDPDFFDLAIAIDNGAQRIIDCNKIHFISSYNNAVERNNNLLHVYGTKAFRVKFTIDELLAVLGTKYFRISRFAAVNLNKVISFDVKSKTCKVKSYTLKIGKDYWPSFLKVMDNC